MFSPIVLEAYDALFASSPVLEESQIFPDSEAPKTAPCVTSTNETSDILSSGCSCDCDPTSERHWFLHTRQWVHRQSTDSSIDTSESLQLRALLSPVLNGQLEELPQKSQAVNIEVQVVEIEESND